MLSPELVQLAAIALAALAACGAVYVLVMPFVSGERKAEKRVATVAQGCAKGAEAGQPRAAATANAQAAGPGHDQEYRGQTEG